MDTKVTQKTDVGSLAELVNEATAKPAQAEERGPLWGTDGEEQNPGDVKQAAWWLAVYVLRAARAYEAAYDTEAATKTRKESPLYANVDYKKFYTKTLRQCVEDVVPEAYRVPVHCLLFKTWNDAQDWATELLLKD